MGTRQDPAVAGDGERFTYPRAATVAALLRAAAGMSLTLGPLALIRPTATAAVVLGALGLLFFLYGALAVLRAGSPILIDGAGLRSDGPFPRAVPWDTLVTVKLSYYTTKRDRSDGWMVLTLKGAGRRLRIESTLTGFARLLARIVVEAESRGIALSPSTRGNLRPFGIDVGERAGQGVAR